MAELTVVESFPEDGDILFLMAAEAEYGPQLRRRIRPVMTGIGPIEAAIETTVALQRRIDRGVETRLVVSLGSAGSRTLEQGAIFQAASVSWRDMDASPLGFVRGVTPFVDHPVAVPLPLIVPGLPAVRLSTGATVVSGEAYVGIDADMVDMETFAVWRAANRFGVPLAALRGISDGAEELRHHADWTALLPEIDRHLADAVDRLLAEWRAGRVLI